MIAHQIQHISRCGGLLPASGGILHLCICERHVCGGAKHQPRLGGPASAGLDTGEVLSCIAEQRHRTDKARADDFTAFGDIKLAKKTGKSPHLHIYDITRKSTGAPNEPASNGATMRWPTSKRRDDGMRAKHTATGRKVAQSSGIKTTARRQRGRP
jgi:hypothetical protein